MYVAQQVQEYCYSEKGTRDKEESAAPVYRCTLLPMTISTTQSAMLLVKSRVAEAYEQSREKDS
jgi:hypothetical protein